MAKKRSREGQGTKRESKNITPDEQTPVVAATLASLTTKDGEIPVFAEDFYEESIPSLYDVKQYIGLRSLAALDDRKILYTRFNLQCYTSYDKRFLLRDEHNKQIGSVSRIPLSAVWADMVRFVSRSTIENQFKITQQEWTAFRDAVTRYIESKGGSKFGYARYDGNDGCPVLVQDLWEMSEIEFKRLELENAGKMIAFLRAEIINQAKENTAIAAQFKKIRRYPHALPLEFKDDNLGIFNERDAALVRRLGISKLNEIRSKTNIVELKNLFLTHEYTKLVREINAAYKEDFERRLDFRYKVWPYIIGFIALVASSVIGYIYQYTLLKNKPMTAIIITLLVVWAFTVAAVVRGACRAPRRRRTKRPFYYYFTTSIKSVVSVFAAITACTFISTTVFYERYDGYDDLVYYKNLKNHEISVAGLFDEDRTVLNIPSSIDGKTVVRISWRAFNKDDFRTVTVPNTVKEIKNGAFYKCENLQNAVLPDGITALPNKMFYGCKELVSCEVPANVKKIGTKTFYNCEKLSIDSLTDSLVEIGSSAFKGCKSLVSLADTNSVTDVGNSAFSGCVSLKTIDFPSAEYIGKNAFRDCKALIAAGDMPSLNYLGSNAFRDCSSLKEMALSNTVESIGEKVFYNCGSLNSLTLPYLGESADKSEKYKYLFDKETPVESLRITGQTSIVDNAFKDNQSLRTVYLDNGVNEIGKNAFSGCVNLESVRLPDSITEIPDGLFKECSSLIELNGFGNVVAVGDEAFFECQNFTDADKLNHLEKIGKCAFYGCKALTDVQLDRVVELGDKAFEYCSSIRTLSIGDKLEYISTSAFEECNRLQEVSGYANVTRIEKRAFYNCSDLAQFEFTNNTEYVGEKAYYGCRGLTSIEVPKSVTEIGKNVFEKCNGISEITLPFIGKTRDTSSKYSYTYIMPNDDMSITVTLTDMEKLYDKSFRDCTSVVRVVLNDDVTEISGGAFKGATRLKTITIPSRVTVIEKDTFSDCSLLENIINAESIAEIQSGAFEGCTSLRSADFPSVVSIGNNAFRGCTALKGIGDMVYLQEVGDSAFRDCTALNAMGFSTRVESIGSKVFYGCTNLNTLTVPFIGPNAEKGKTYTYLFDEDVPVTTLSIIGATSLANNALKSCGSVDNVVLGDGVSSIGKSAFENCKNLVTVNVPARVTEFLDGTFKNCAELERIDGFDRIVSVGKEAFSGCTNFKDTNELAGLERIGASAFEYCTSITALNLEKLKEIGQSAFFGCRWLETVTIGNSLEYINTSAFEECNRLREVSGYANVTRIEKRAFYNCSALERFEFTNKTEYVGEKAYYGCRGLTSVAVPKSVTEIGKNVFEKCNGISEITLPFIGKTRDTSSKYSYTYIMPNDDMSITVTLTDMEKLYDKSFRDCTSVVRVVLNDDVTEISGGAFKGATRLKTITIPNRVTVIEKDTFRDCALLESVGNTGNVIEIQSGAFKNCTSLRSANFPSAVSIGSDAFLGCTALISIGDMENLKELGNNVFRDCTALQSATLYPSLESMGKNIFHGCTHLTSLSVPFIGATATKTKNYKYLYGEETPVTSFVVSGETKIGDGAFKGNHNIREIVLNNGVSAIGKNAFEDCTQLRRVTLPNGISELAKGTFKTCNNLEIVHGFENITVVGEEAFSDCYAFTDEQLLSQLERIGKNAFSGCSSMTIVTLDNAKEIGAGAFKHCLRLETVDLSKTLNPVLGDDIFRDCTGIENLLFPEAIEKIPEGFAYGLKSLKYIEWPSRVAEIEENAFRGCGFEAVSIPLGVTTIGKNAFAENYSLRSISLPNSVEYIGKRAFNCGNEIQSIVMPFLGKKRDSAFYGYKHVFGSTRVAHIGITDMVEINKNAFSGGRDYVQVVVLGTSTLSIESGAFRNCIGLSRISLPATLTSIGSNAFRNCTALTGVDIPAGVTEIGNNAFRGSNIARVTFLGNALKKVGGSVFRSCENLRQIEFNEGLEEIGGDAFRDCSSLELVYIPKSVQTIGWQVFSNCTKLKSITIPFLGKNRENSKTAEWYWFGWLHDAPTSGLEVEITDALTIKKKAFKNCEYLTVITLNDGITEIGEDAFAGCSNLETIYLPMSLFQYDYDFPVRTTVKYY